MVISKRVGRSVVVVTLGLALLTGCSGGRAPEANRGQEQDTKRESVISDMQATHTWELVNGPPEATPTEEP